MTDEKVRENRLRRIAERQGLRLEKSRRRDLRAVDYGAYFLIDGPAQKSGGDNWRSRTLATSDQGISLDEAEAYLMGADNSAYVLLPMNGEDLLELRREMDEAATHVDERLRAFTKEHSLLGLSAQLEGEILNGLRPTDRPEEATKLNEALADFAHKYRG